MLSVGPAGFFTSVIQRPRLGPAVISGRLAIITRLSPSYGQVPVQAVISASLVGITRKQGVSQPGGQDSEITVVVIPRVKVGLRGGYTVSSCGVCTPIPTGRPAHGTPPANTRGRGLGTQRFTRAPVTYGAERSAV